MRLIRPIAEAEQREAWLKIWHESVSGQLAAKVRDATWDRLIDEDVPLFGFLAYIDERTPVGYLHYALHPITGALEPAAYMQDLFVLPQYRRRGYARALMKALTQRGQSEKWDRIVWYAEGDNETAGKFYEEFGTKLNFNFYIYGIAMLRRLLN